MSDQPKQASNMVAIITLLIFVACIATIWYSARTIAPSWFAHSGPQKLFSVGIVRVNSCSYQGEFIGGYGYECSVRNWIAEQAEVTILCSSYDKNERMIGQPQVVGALFNSTFSPNEERVVRIYGAEKSATVICMQSEGEMPAAPLQPFYEKFNKTGYTTTIDLTSS